MSLRHPPTASLRETHFRNSRLGQLGVEVMSVAELRGRERAAAERVNFYMLVLVEQGTGSHMIDFRDWMISAGSVLFVRPGQVQRWKLTTGYDAQILLVAPPALPLHDSGAEAGLLSMDDWPPCSELPKAGHSAFLRELRAIRQELDKFEGKGLEVALVRHMTICLLLRLALVHTATSKASPRDTAEPNLYRRFLSELESGFLTHHDAGHYARRLNCSISTLTRACLVMEGRTAKTVIDRRVVLEASRLLVHSEAAVSEVAHELGFPEPTNFARYFNRVAGVTPAAFREAYRV